MSDDTLKPDHRSGDLGHLTPVGTCYLVIPSNFPLTQT